ncbi:MAG TPA: (Fe-S)-binding protein [Bacillota bacterium]
MTPQDLEQKLIKCIRCGTCLKDCPIYQETLDEQFTPRAKIQLAQAILQDRTLELSEGLRGIAENCLLCRSCREACPNKVDGPEFTLLLRENLVDRRGESAIKSGVFNVVVPRPGLIGLGVRMASLAQAFRLDRLAAAVTGLFSKEGKKLVDYAPRLSIRPLTATYPTGAVLPPLGGGRPKARVAYFYGCVTNEVFPATGRATIEVLRRNGHEVVLPRQNCCGVPASANGDLEPARKMARANTESFAKAGADWIVTRQMLWRRGFVHPDPPRPVDEGGGQEGQERLGDGGRGPRHRLPELPHAAHRRDRAGRPRAAGASPCRPVGEGLRRGGGLARGGRRGQERLGPPGPQANPQNKTKGAPPDQVRKGSLGSVS